MHPKRLLNCLTGSLAPVFLCIAVDADAQSGANSNPLFEDHSLLEVRIEAPLTTLMKDRPDEEYLEGALSYTGSDGRDHKFDLKLQTRGRYRRQKKTCDFAPIRLNFKTGQLDDTVFAGQDKLKLVTHCNSRRDSYEQLVLREYLAYRILQTLTERSFGARLMRINYVDTERDEPLTRFGFVIEDDDDVGARLGMQELKSSGLNYNELDAAYANLINIFQYLIGNTDYSLIRGPADDDCCHNSVPFSAGGTLIAVPYDLDFSGLVDAPYAEPNAELKIRTVRTRLYRGRCSNNQILPDTLAYVQSKKSDIYALVGELTGLDDRNRRDVIGYLDDFFEEIDEPKQVERKLLRKCL